jgi:hypothetical protein
MLKPASTKFALVYHFFVISKPSPSIKTKGVFDVRDHEDGAACLTFVSVFVLGVTVQG